VRVRVAAGRRLLLLEGSPVRAWSAGGTLLAAADGAVAVAAAGGKVSWGGERLFDSPVDVGSPEGVRIDGKLLAGRVRLSASGGTLRAVSLVPLEEYVAAVLVKEAAPSFHPEALAALAVAVRTYALTSMARPRDPDYDLASGVEDQVFDGLDGVAAPFRAAAEATRGQALHFGGALARTVYHSTCGGRTESAANAWGGDFPYLRPVFCDDCRDSPAWRWEYRLGRAEGGRIARALGVPPGDRIAFEVATRTSTGRADRMRVRSAGVTRELRAASFREAAGYAKVRSLKMEIAPDASGWRIAGEGYGHGVGMCQWGANGMAKAGKGFREILARYYPGTRLAGARH
jgi:stage II sporulation protein D